MSTPLRTLAFAVLIVVLVLRPGGLSLGRTAR